MAPDALYAIICSRGGAMDDNSEPGSAFWTDPEQDPELSVERLMSELVDQASAILSAQHRLRRLLSANRSIVQELSLPAVLRRIVHTAKDVAGALFAIGIIGKALPGRSTTGRSNA